MNFMKNNYYVFLTIFFLNIIGTIFSIKNNELFSEEDIIYTIKTDNESEFRNAVEKLNNIGGIILIDTPIININLDLTIEIGGTIDGGIIGIKQINDEYPIINFKNVRDAFKPNTISKGMISITGTNKFLKYLIIEKSACYGINISGKKTTLDHIITRYNSFPGISLYNSEDTTLNYCYSYRNFGKYSYGELGAGFAIDLGTSINTIFNYCYAWDNSNDGFLTFSHAQAKKLENLSLFHSACWNNGNLDIFTGKYDYDLGKPLDKNLWSIEDIINSDENFESNYKNKTFNINNAKIIGENVNEWIVKANGNIDGNGFEFGWKTASNIQNSQRIGDYLISFDNKNSGFINKNGQKCLASFTNNVGFNNNINYQLTLNFEKWSNNWSWGDTKNSQTELDFKKPNNINSAQKLFYSVRDQMINTISSNKFNDNLSFDYAINNLKN